MDPLSQSSLGAAVAASPAGRAELRAGAFAGLLAGLAPDLDVLIRSSTDPLLFLEYHRQLSHALVFVPVGAALCAAVLYPLMRRRLGFPRLLTYCLLGYGSHGLLDACTSYGTQLLWPFSDVRVAWNVVSVVDPLFTVPLMLALAVSVAARRRSWAVIGLAWAVLYLGAGQIQQWRAEQAAQTLASGRGHEVDSMLVKPAFGNLLLWKSVYRSGGWYYVDALRAGMHVTAFPGERVRVLEMDPRWSPPAPGSRQHRDLERFERFSAGYLALAEDDPTLIVDVRYSLVPNQVDPLWGIRLRPATPDGHAGFETDRETTPADRAALTRMLFGSGTPL
ncbi:MAG: metal-dependent hydrolase [Gammaproteobacteria bacterium]|nr:metal-dependent hydrolase [Gammaproteobacteria bacterium]|tara:strand:+ start:1081 stop:2085 length:1005 start_codon:yes stop_codon:yes gene_type:complete